jgi:hypothetical protein
MPVVPAALHFHITMQVAEFFQDNDLVKKMCDLLGHRLFKARCVDSDILQLRSNRIQAAQVLISVPRVSMIVADYNSCLLCESVLFFTVHFAVFSATIMLYVHSNCFSHLASVSVT